MAPSAQPAGPPWLKVLVIAMGLLIVVGFIVVVIELGRRITSANVVRAPSAPFGERIALPSGARVVAMTAAGDRLVVHVEMPGGAAAAYVVDPRSGGLLGTVEFPPGAAR